MHESYATVWEAAVVGVPDERWGEAVGAVVAVSDGPDLATAEIGDWVADRLAGYKRPRRVAVVDEVRRTTVSKVDLEWARAVLAEAQR